MNDNITISKKEYEKLLEDSEFLLALKHAGVDNWEGYSYAIDLLGNYNKE